MARSNVSNSVAEAIGTQRQFHEQEKAVSKLNLINPTFGAGISQSTDYDTQLLKQSLGLLATGIMEEAEASNKRAEQRLTDRANRVWQSSTNEERMTMSSIDLLNKYGYTDHSNSDYAVTRMEVLRGQYYKQMWHDEFIATEKDKNPFATTSAQYVKNYEDFMNRKLAEQKKVKDFGILNDTAFNEGFYGSRPLDLIKLDEDYQKKRKAKFEFERNNGIANIVSELYENFPMQDIHQAVEGLKAFTKDERLGGCDDDQKQKTLDALFKKIAEYGKGEYFTALKNYKDKDENGNEVNGMIIGTKLDGSPMVISPSLLDHYRDLSDKYDAKNFGEAYRTEYNKVMGMSPDAIPDYIQSLQKTNPRVWKQIAPHTESIVNKRTKAVKSQQAAAMAGAERVIQKDIIRERIDAIMQGKTVDSRGFSVNVKDYISGKDKNGNDKYGTIHDDVINQAISEKIQENLVAVQNGKMSMQEVAKANLSIYASPLAKNQVNAYKVQISKALNNLDPATLENQYALPKELENTLAMWKTDPSTFMYVFGDNGKESNTGTNMTSKLHVLNNLIDANGGNVATATKRYQSIKEVYNNSDKSKLIHKRISDSLFNSPSIQIRNLADTSDESINLEKALIAPDMLKTIMFENLALGETNISNARKDAVTELNNSFVSFRGDVIPKAFFNVFPNQQAANTFLEDYFKAESRNRGIDPENVHVTYNPNDKQMIITFGNQNKGEPIIWDNHQMAKECVKFYKDQQKKTNSQVTLDYLNTDHTQYGFYQDFYGQMEALYGE